MHPILFEIWGFPVYTYGVLLAAAYLLGLLGLRYVVDHHVRSQPGDGPWHLDHH